MLKSFKKSMIILFSCVSVSILASAATPNVTPKRSSEYLSQSSRALSSPYSTVADVAISGNLATVKETGQPFTGTYVEFSENGNAQAVRNYQNGTLNGPMFLYYGNGNIQKVVNYVNGVRNGEDIDFYGNGNSKVLKNYQNGLLNGKSYEFDEFGRLTASLEYVNNAKNGKELKFSNGVITNENTYANGQLNGEAKSYYSNGNLRSNGNYSRNFRNGQWTWNYENGSKKLIETYQNGLVTEILGYSRNGGKEREMKLVNGNGNFTQYYDNGKVKVQGALRNYKAYGNWSFYNKDGYLTDTQGFY
ncbi:toxin-antitoxin system YwqK family antitoxin [Leptotrichia trevisanii]|uniref:toxin-antitoxin system YwqK family antitoxin n=1 Tax=Leptotrichia trevisanii TaxID=109328 RepID=UPI0026EBA25C|nr:toxin-antitoxin system YwqK family antitoxin [Leptotrichia trevisanii]